MTEDASAPTPSEQRATAAASAEQLVAARERLGMGKGEVAQRLKLHPRQLDAIERGDWAALPGRAFARGSVRAYGRLLGVDVDPLLASIGGIGELEALKPSASLAAPLPRTGGFGFEAESHRGKLPWAVLGVIGVIAVGLFFGRDGDVSKVTSWIGKTDTPVSVPAPAPAPASVPSTATPAAPGSTVVTAPAGEAAPGVPLVPPPLVGGAVPATAGAPAAAGSPPAGPPPAAPAAGAPTGGAATPPPPPPLRFTVKQDAWIEVRQADGRTAFVGIVKPGVAQDVKADAPFSITVGNASAVTLERDGKPVDLKAATAMPQNIAKLKLP